MTATLDEFKQEPSPDCTCSPAEGISKCNKIYAGYWEFDDNGIPCKVPGSGASALGAAAFAIAATYLF